MKILYLVRHSKSMLQGPKVDDLDRPLRKSGILDTISQGKKLATKGFCPDLIISSEAIRTVHTAILLARAMSYPVRRIYISSRLYTADWEGVVKIVSQTDDKFDSLMLVGHDPAFTNLLNQIKPNFMEKFPAGAVIRLVLEAKSWSAIQDSLIKEVDIYLPSGTEEKPI